MKDAAADPEKMSDAPQTASQNAALCWRMHRGRVQVLLVTSRDTGRWIVPKGWPIAGKTGAETAAIEAWEEAGVEGPLDGADPIGRYGYDKWRSPKKVIPCTVSLFSLRVMRLADKFPERKQRRRKWFDAQKAARKVDEPELRALLSQVTLQGKRLIWATPDEKPA